MEQRALDSYRVRALIAVGMIGMSFALYFCWEVLYQERAIVTLLAFTEMERSKEADRKNFLHEWIMDRHSSDDGTGPIKAAPPENILAGVEYATRDVISDPGPGHTGGATTSGTVNTLDKYLTHDRMDLIAEHPIKRMNDLVKAYNKGRQLQRRPTGQNVV